MTRRLRHAETKTDAFVAMSHKSAAVQAAHLLAEGIEDIGRGSDPQFRGNIADALYHIGTALNRIAEAMERKP